MISRFLRGAECANGTAAVLSWPGFRRTRFGIGAMLAISLTACAGGSGSIPQAQAPVPSQNAAPQPGAEGTSGARLVMRVLIPHRHRHRGHYVSPSTQSLVVTEGKIVKTFNTTPNSSGCETADGGTLCTFKMFLAAGKSETIGVNAYDATGGVGNLLSTGSVTRTIVKGLNYIPITLEGVVVAVQVALTKDDPPAGTATTVGVNVMALDKDGNYILGAGNYSAPILLSTNDATGTVQLQQTSVTYPGQIAQLAYNGHSIDGVTITASGTGVRGATTVFSPIPTVVSDFGLSPSVRRAPQKIQRPVHRPHAVAGQQPTAVVTGPDGKIYAAVSNLVFGIEQITTGGTTRLFESGHSPSTNLPAAAISGLAVSGGMIWYVDNNSVGFLNPSTGAVTDYPWATGTGICGGPSGVRATPDGKGGIWVTLQCASDSQIAEISNTGVMTFTTMSNFVQPHDLIVGSDGNVYVAGQDETYNYAAMAQVTVAGAHVVTNVLDIPALPNVFLVGIAQTANGDLWATTGSCSPSAFVRVTEFGSSEDVFPTFGCSEPYYLKALPDGDLWAAAHAYAGATRMIPNGYPAAPTEFDMLLPTPDGVQGADWDVTLGNDGDLYFSDDSSTLTTAGDIAKVAY